MFGSYRQSSCCRNHLRLRLLLALLSLVLATDLVAAQQNITLDDTNLYIIYAPATSWHASTVECDSCLAPSSAEAHGGTWHDGTHVVPTTDEDDEGTVGDTDGDGTTTSSASTSLSSASKSTLKPSSSLSANPAQTSAVDDDDNDDDDGKKGGKGGDADGKRRLKRRVQSSRGRLLAARVPTDKRDEENPFEVQNTDSDDPGFQDVPVTATLNFTGQAIYVFAILPLFPAPPNTTPTFTNLSFTLDGIALGSFTYRPDATVEGTPTVNSSVSDKYQSNVNIFSASGLEDTAHSFVVNVGVDSVLLLDYVMYTVGSSDPTAPGSITTAAPDSQRTAGAVGDSSKNKHNVATFAGAVGGSVGLLSVLALGLCISIKYRRRRAHQRDRRAHAAFAETFTARDHGEDGPDDEEDTAFGRQRVNGQPAMAQAHPAPFVPRYFPGSLPASPPPYVAEGTAVNAASPLMVSMNRAGVPVAVPSTLPPMIALPTAILDLQRTTSNNTSNSYADRPPPTPPDEVMRISLFGREGVREERNLNGGVIGPLPVDSPSSEESDPMLGVELDDEDEEEERSPARMDRRMSPESIGSHTFGTSRSSRSSGLSEPSGAGASSTLTPYSLPISSASSMSASPVPTPKHDGAVAPSSFPTLSTATSILLPSFPAEPTPSSSQLLASPTSPDLAPKPSFSGGLSSIAYPLLQPSRVPLPPSMYGSEIGSQETLTRHDSRT